MGNELAKRLVGLKAEAEKREDSLLVGIIEVLRDIFDGPGGEEQADPVQASPEVQEPPVKVYEPAKVRILNDAVEEPKRGTPQHLPPIPEARSKPVLGRPGHEKD